MESMLKICNRWAETNSLCNRLAGFWFSVFLFFIAHVGLEAEETPPLYELLKSEDGEGLVIPIQGVELAPVVIIEIRSFSCSHCQQFHENVYPMILEKFVETGKVRWGILDVSEDLRLKDPKLFELTRCLDHQDLYWKNQDFFFEYEYQPSSFLAMDAEFLEGVEVKELRKCFAKGLTSAEVKTAYAAMRQKNVKALPTFFLCKRNEDGTWIEKRLEGAWRYSDFAKELRAFESE